MHKSLKSNESFVNRLDEPQITHDYRELNMIEDRLASMAANRGLMDEVLLFWEPPSAVQEIEKYYHQVRSLENISPS
ncbi:hypothetical protein RND71_003754 [Anisodus tanguticus]|uniref:Uncharacterized protein n=1 Tax=Anisodus tanguticus TaxID=243964 RepID=A0AAE1STW0_9SOLA|nr:hypothetical protein RND71_003754 [Anisodus tanguticus]